MIFLVLQYIVKRKVQPLSRLKKWSWADWPLQLKEEESDEYLLLAISSSNVCFFAPR